MQRKWWWWRRRDEEGGVDGASVPLDGNAESSSLGPRVKF